MSVHIIHDRPVRKANLELELNMKYFGFTGLSTDTKPTVVNDGGKEIAICNGSYFLEVDTGNCVYFNGDTGSWEEE